MCLYTIKQNEMEESDMSTIMMLVGMGILGALLYKGNSYTLNSVNRRKI